MKRRCRCPERGLLRLAVFAAAAFGTFKLAERFLYDPSVSAVLSAMRSWASSKAGGVEKSHLETNYGL